jgi:hypothetical protein
MRNDCYQKKISHYEFKRLNRPILSKRLFSELCATNPQS